MDDQTRDDLLAKLADAERREALAVEQLKAHAGGIENIRKRLGNPYFYGGRPADDLESEAHFTGYKSHEPAFALWRKWQDVSREIATIREALGKAGSGSA
jgi:hypothetical protein